MSQSTPRLTGRPVRAESWRFLATTNPTVVPNSLHDVGTSDESLMHDRIPITLVCEVSHATWKRSMISGTRDLGRAPSKGRGWISYKRTP